MTGRQQNSLTLILFSPREPLFHRRFAPLKVSLWRRMSAVATIFFILTVALCSSDIYALRELYSTDAGVVFDCYRVIFAFGKCYPCFARVIFVFRTSGIASQLYSHPVRVISDILPRKVTPYSPKSNAVQPLKVTPGNFYLKFVFAPRKRTLKTKE